MTSATESRQDTPISSAGGKSSAPRGLRLAGAILALLAICSAALQAQTIIDGEDEVAAREFSLNVEKSAARYSGTYAFGFSEGESALKLTVKGTKATGVLSYGEFDNSGNWHNRSLKFSGKVIGGMLVADKWYAVFVKRGDQKGLVFYEAPTDYVKGNFGHLTDY